MPNARVTVTLKFSASASRCVKYAGDHPTINCRRKIRSDLVKCVLCDNNHPTNYKECTIYKKLQKSKYPALQKKTQSSNLQQRTETQDMPTQIILIQIRVFHTRQRLVLQLICLTWLIRMSRILKPLLSKTTLITQINDIQELKYILNELMVKLDLVKHINNSCS